MAKRKRSSMISSGRPVPLTTPLEQKPFFSPFFHQTVKILLVLLKLNPTYTTLIAKEADITYSHTCKVIDMFKKLGLVKFEKKSRVKVINLTEDGLEIAKDFRRLIQKFNKMERK